MHNPDADIWAEFESIRPSRYSVTYICQKNRKLHKFATTNSIFEKKMCISNMHHHIAYMYINFQQNRVSRSVKTVHTNLIRYFFSVTIKTTNKMYARRTRIFSRARMRSSNSARMNKFNFTTEKIV